MLIFPQCARGQNAPVLGIQSWVKARPHILVLTPLPLQGPRFCSHVLGSWRLGMQHTFVRGHSPPRRTTLLPDVTEPWAARARSGLPRTWGCGGPWGSRPQTEAKSLPRWLVAGTGSLSSQSILKPLLGHGPRSTGRILGPSSEKKPHAGTGPRQSAFRAFPAQHPRAH